MSRRTFVSLAVAVLSVINVFGERVITTKAVADYSPPMVGNGWLGAVMSHDGFAPEKVFVADGVVPGGRHGVSSIIRAVSPVNLQVLVNGREFETVDWEQTLNMDSAFVETRHRGKDADVSVRFMALRSLKNAIMATVSIRALKSCNVVIVNRMDGVEKGEERRVWCRDGGIRVLHGSKLFGSEIMEAAAVFVPGNGMTEVSADTVAFYLERGEEASCSVVGTVCTSRLFSDAWNEAERQAVYAYEQGVKVLVDRHSDLWSGLWKSGNVKVEDDAWLQRVADACVYNLYSNMDASGARSVAPMGLTSEKYYGHVFWDADTWILPVMVELQPEFARSMLEFRYNGLAAARMRAGMHGYRGAMFPWEADVNGEESTPTFALTGPMEHHITADVANAAWLFYERTCDIDWLRERGYPIIKDCADFWVSRVSDNGDGTYSIRNVVGADEYAEGVDDNAFTNGAAKRALEAAIAAAGLLGERADDEWARVASGLRFHYNSDGSVAEYEGYDGALIKQADAALLAYPLGLLTERDEIERTISHYASKLDMENGPAMSHALMAVNYGRMGDEKRWREMLLQGLTPYLRGPFLNIAETPSNDETYFLTGAGAVLQAIMFGKCHFNIRRCIRV